MSPILTLAHAKSRLTRAKSRLTHANKYIKTVAAFSIWDVTLLPCGGLKGGKLETLAMGARVGLGVGDWGPAAFPTADAYMSGLSVMAAAALV